MLAAQGASSPERQKSDVMLAGCGRPGVIVTVAGGAVIVIVAGLQELADDAAWTPSITVENAPKERRRALGKCIVLAMLKRAVLVVKRVCSFLLGNE